MPKLFRKDLKAVVSPMARAANLAINAVCLSERFVPTPGYVSSHILPGTVPPAGAVEWEGFTLEWSACRRARVVCNVPTPYSLYTFMYCLKRGGKPLAYGSTIPEFLDSAMRAIHKITA